MPLFAEAGGGCSGTGPDRVVGRQGFLLLAPWVSVLSSSASLEQGSYFPGWGCQTMGEEENEWKEHTTDPGMGLGSEDRSLLPQFIPTDLVLVK